MFDQLLHIVAQPGLPTDRQLGAAHGDVLILVTNERPFLLVANLAQTRFDHLLLAEAFRRIEIARSRQTLTLFEQGLAQRL